VGAELHFHQALCLRGMQATPVRSAASGSGMLLLWVYIIIIIILLGPLLTQ
jgi:hypothetical protein